VDRNALGVPENDEGVLIAVDEAEPVVLLPPEKLFLGELEAAVGEVQTEQAVVHLLNLNFLLNLFFS